VKVSRRRVQAIFRKELREYRRNGFIVATMVIVPLIFIIVPLIDVSALPASMVNVILDGDPLAILLGIPAIVPATVSAYAVVGERQQGTLEPALTTPIRREEFLLGKALASLVPSVVVSLAVYAAFLGAVHMLARPEVSAAVMQGRYLLAQVMFTPLIAGWSVWVGIAISARSSDLRVAQQFGTLAMLPPYLVTLLIAINKIPATLGLAIGLGLALLLVDVVGWPIMSAAFDREQLISGTR